MSAPKIAIIGAGPAGCTLARLLHQASIPVTVFEGEVALDHRSQGGTLDLHTDTGIAALKEAGLYDAFLRYARFDGEALVICDKKLKKYINVSGGKEGSRIGRPEIDRAQLRRILIDSLPEGVIRWGSRLRRVEDSQGTPLLHFDHGVERGFDLVVGADGAWSKVRPVVSDAKPYFSGTGGFSLTISSPEERCPGLYALVNRGSVFAFSDGKCITAQQMGDGKLYIGTWSVKSEDWMETATYDLHDLDATKDFLLGEYHDWAPELKDSIQMADGDLMPRSLSMLLVGHRWRNKPGVTLLGDAAHLMTPFAGQGVNLAMQDAMELAHAIIGAAKSTQANALAANIKAYEEGMFERATPVQEMTFAAMTDMFFVPGAPDASIERYILHLARHTLHPVVHAVLAVVVYTYFWWFRLWHRYMSGWRTNVQVTPQKDLKATLRSTE